MIVKTHAIVIGYIKYRETSVIIRMYTREQGFQSFVASGVRNKKAKLSIGLFQPLNLLEIVAYWSSKSDLHRLNEAKIMQPTPSFQIDNKKSTLVMFLSELTGKTLMHEHYENEPLYRFFEKSIIELDLQESAYESFHIYFMVKYSRFLGFEIQDVSQVGDSLNHELEPAIDLISQFINMEIYQDISSSGAVRSKALETLVQYFQNHLEHLGELKSLKILKSIFH